MGNLANQQDITISVHSPTRGTFNFHTDYLPDNRLQLLDYPSFIKKNDRKGIEYSKRSNYNDRQYQITYEQEDQNTSLLFSKMSQQTQPIWKVITPNQTLPLFEGCVLKLGDTLFEVKKICRNFNELEEWQQNLMTVYDGDPRDSINNDLFSSRNLMDKMVNSRKLQNSRFLNFSRNDKNFAKNDSKSSFAIDSDADFCRYCYGRDSTSSNPLLNLCKCSGSVKYSHYFCLKNWISSRSVTRASDCYEYFEYDLSCEVCKNKIEKKTVHKGKKYVIYSESIIHPPFVVLSYKNESTTKVKEYIINFDYSSSIKIGKGTHCDIQLPQRMISNEQCELIFDHGQILLRSLNSTFGTFIQIDSEWNFSPVDNQLQVMIGNHLVRIKDQSSSCFYTRPLKLKIIDKEDN